MEIKTKEKLYRGIDLDKLKSLDIRESAKYLTSRSRRSVLRQFDTIGKFVNRWEKQAAQNKRIRTHLRDLIIVPKLVGLKISVYNGKSFMDILLTKEMIGHRLGEFAMSRRPVKHGAAGIGATKSSKAEKK